MIESLVAFAKRKNLVFETGFAPRSVPWMINIPHKGQINLIEAPTHFQHCPVMQQGDLCKLRKHLAKRGIAVKSPAHFLFDYCSRVVLYPQPVDEKQLERHHTFVELIRLAAIEVPQFDLIHQVLTDSTQIQIIQDQLIQKKAVGIHKISFAIDEKAVLEADYWHGWWRTFLQSLADKPLEPMVCLATGEIGVYARVHPKLTGLATQKPSFGTTLITADKAAFGSFGLTQAQNAALSELAANAYPIALDTLLAEVPFLEGIKMIVWYDADLPDDQNPLISLLKPNLAHKEPPVRQASFEQIKKIQMRIELNSLNPRLGAHVAAFCERDGRARTLFYQPSTLGDLALATNVWLEKTSIATLNAPQGVVLDLNDFVNFLIAKETKETQRDQEQNKKAKWRGHIQSLLVCLLQTILQPNLAIPSRLVLHVQDSILAAILNGKFSQALISSKNAIIDNDLAVCMGILRAYFINKGDQNLHANVNPNHSSVNYQSGRMAAIFETLRSYEGSVSIRPHHRLLSFITTPQESLQLERKFHSLKPFGKMEKHWFVYRIWLELEQVWEKIDSTIPNNWSLDHRGMFLLGYYQQFIYNQNELINAI